VTKNTKNYEKCSFLDMVFTEKEMILIRRLWGLA